MVSWNQRTLEWFRFWFEGVQAKLLAKVIRNYYCKKNLGISNSNSEIVRVEHSITMSRKFVVYTFTKKIIKKFKSLCKTIQILKPGVICLVCAWKDEKTVIIQQFIGPGRNAAELRHRSIKTSSISLNLARSLQLRKVYAMSVNGIRSIRSECLSRAVLIRERCLVTCHILVWSDSCFSLRVLRAQVMVERGDRMM